jgi:hypothetical protein
MVELFHVENQVMSVSNFNDLVTTPFHNEINAICWDRKLIGDFAEIVNKITFSGNIFELELEELIELNLSEQGEMAREILINDFKLLKNHGAEPILNIIKCYDRDESLSFFPTDVYSYHVDRSTIASDTFLCTYHGETSDILPNSKGIQKILIPEIREALKKYYEGKEEDFDSFLIDNFFDLHYQALPNAKPISLGLGQLWRLACDSPDSPVLPCLHRAPIEKVGENRLLMIC